MKPVKSAMLLHALLLLCASFFFSSSFAQGTLTKRSNVYINSNVNGFLEYLPEGYHSSGAQYPLIVFINGLNTQGTGSDADLELHFTGSNAPHEQQRAGTWVDAYNVNGTTHRFVIITPQFVTNFNTRMPSPQEVDDVVNYALQQYRINASRVYLMGHSSGGGPVWEYPGHSSAYAKKIAAILPFSAVSFPTEQRANRLKHGNVAVWAFHNLPDPLVPVSFTQDYVNMINGGAPPAIPARGTFRVINDHGSWSEAYGRTYTENGMNIYQWMLQYSKQVSRAFAGEDREITPPASSAQLAGSGTGPNGTATAYSWQQISGPGSAGISSPGSSSTQVSGLVSGAYVFQLSITDNSGATATDRVAVTVYPPTTRIEAENYSAASGVQVGSFNTPEEGQGQSVGYIDQGDWMDYSVNVPSNGNYKVRLRIGTFMSGAQLEIRNSSGSVLSTIPIIGSGGWDNYWTYVDTIPLVAGTQTIRIQSMTASGWNFNWLEVEGASTGGPPPPPPNQSPTVQAGQDQTITLPTSSVNLNGSANDPDGSISQYQWTQVSGPAAAQFSAPNAAATSAGGLQQGTYTFRLTVTDNGGAQAADDVVVTVNGSQPPPPPPPPSNRVEAEQYTAQSGTQTESTSDAGGGQNVGYIDNGDWMDYSINIPSAGNYSLDFRIATQMSGAQFQVRNSSGSVLGTVNVPNTGGWQSWSTTTVVVNLPAGTQTIRLISTAAAGWNINWWEWNPGNTPANQAPTVSAGTDQTITLPASSATLQGTASDADGSIASYSWTQVAGPSSASISSPSQAGTTVSNLQQGIYTFRLTVTDNGGASAQDDVTITVNGSTPPPGGTLRIEAENYSAQSGTQLEATADAGGGQNVGYIDQGDWMDYAVNLSSGGTYTLSLRIASGMTGSQVQVRTSGGEVLATISIPGTGGWQSWQTVTASVNLQSGMQTLRLLSSAAANWNINWLELTPGGTPPPPPPPSGTRYEAENYTAQSGTQTEGTADEGGGQNVGYIDNGDWMEYSVNVASAGSYTFNVRVATPMSGGQLQVRNSAGNVLTTINLPVTGGWQTWQTAQGSITLPAGTQTLRIQSSAAANWNINWFELQGGSNPPPPPPPPGNTQKIEAENYSAQSGTQTESTSDAGGGQNVGYIDEGDWMEYSVNLSTAGTYTINFRVASQMTGGQLQVRNSSGAVLATVSVPNTGGWQSWTTISTSVSLPAGSQVLRIVSTAYASWNINWLELVSSGAATFVMREAPENRQWQAARSTGLQLYPNPVQSQLTLTLDHAYTGAVQIQLVGENGVVQREVRTSKGLRKLTQPVGVADLSPGVYTVVIYLKGERVVSRFVKQ